MFHAPLSLRGHLPRKSASVSPRQMRFLSAYILRAIAEMDCFTSFSNRGAT